MKSKDNKPHIGIFGRRNNGKSSIINLMTQQNIAIVSDQAGTTTDPVKKSIEIFGIGPTIIIDTAGIDDTGILGEKRIAKTLETLKIIDIAILVLTNNTFGEPEQKLIEQFKSYDIPFLIVHNKSDLAPLNPVFRLELTKKLHVPIVDFNTLNAAQVSELIEKLKQIMPQTVYQKPSLFAGIVKPNDVVLLVTPIDSEAPEGRMILPQVMAIRDVLDKNAICIVLKETNLKQYFDQNMPQPNLVVTDSQVFDLVNKTVPRNIPLTSFSIVLARLRGSFDYYIKGTPVLSKLNNGDRILMLESCSHQVSCEDIGRIKLPEMIRNFSKKNVHFDIVSGLSPIENIEQYRLVIQCGGCVVTQKQLFNRLKPAIDNNIAVSNYGMTIAYVTGIFDRIMEPFKM
ncbi:MAG: [FeFe] hydrogenase H-cluster maturation GTPase HydF [Lentimicrobiaceae bacterium]|jgi:[FeFe] hydrogenase H-cluster maturation GTPase HydF|nr:[FeFe] hydrogenase H-cluster maturation GTPase HydF [Lentimicrobiaceae bacterium]